MANIKISELNEKTEVGLNDIFPIVDTTTNETKKITGANLLKGQYSWLNEVKTNKKWIDGKPIYRLVSIIPELPVPGSSSDYTYGSFGVNLLYLENLVSINGCYNTSDGRKLPINISSLRSYENGTYITDAEISTWIYPLEGDPWGEYVAMIAVRKIRTLTNGYIVFEYTKTTDVV